MKEVAPSDELRKWFDHDTEKFGEFKTKYKEELADKKDSMEELKGVVVKHKKNVTLVYGAKGEEHNQAVVLKEILDRQ